MSEEELRSLVLRAQEFKEQMWDDLDSIENGHLIKDAYNRFLDELDEVFQ